MSAYAVNKGSVKAFLVWSGVLLYLVYAYCIYAFDVHYNRLFLVYVAILGLSFYTLVSGVGHVPLDRLHASFSAATPTKLVSVFLMVLGILFYLLWLREEIPALLAVRLRSASPRPTCQPIRCMSWISVSTCLPCS